MKRALGIAVALGALAWSGSVRADAQTNAKCVAAFDRGQELQSVLQLRAARAQYLQCARDACHPSVRKDCAQRLEEVTRDLPTVILGARDRRGQDITGVRVYIDGNEVDDAAIGAAIPIDPGEHLIRFDRPSYVQATQTIVVRAGEKNRTVLLTMDDAQASTPGPLPPSTPLPHEGDRKRTEPQQQPTSSGISTQRWFAYGLGAASLIALGEFVFFGIQGKNVKDELLQTCAAACPEREVDKVRGRYLLADLFLVGAIVTGGAATYLFLTEPSKPAVPAAKVVLRPKLVAGPNGASLSVAGAF